MYKQSSENKNLLCEHTNAMQMMAFLILEYRFQNLLRQYRYEFTARDFKGKKI